VAASLGFRPSGEGHADEISEILFLAEQRVRGKMMAWEGKSDVNGEVETGREGFFVAAAGVALNDLRHSGCHCFKRKSLMST